MNGRDYADPSVRRIPAPAGEVRETIGSKAARLLTRAREIHDVATQVKCKVTLDGEPKDVGPPAVAGQNHVVVTLDEIDSVLSDVLRLLHTAEASL